MSVAKFLPRFVSTLAIIRAIRRESGEPLQIVWFTGIRKRPITHMEWVIGRVQFWAKRAVIYLDLCSSWHVMQDLPILVRASLAAF